MFVGDDEDGDFLSPTGGAKLASLFGLDQEASQRNESFQYMAPKQPRKSSCSAANQKAAPSPGAPAVLLATAVQAFRYIGGQYVKQGKLGAAVLGSHTTKEYKLLLYLSQQKPVTAAKIHMGFIFTVQPNNYCTFYDDQRQNWSLMFESEKSAADFCKEVCLVKANSASPLDAVIIQDLSLGEGQAVEDGDLLEVVYTGWLLQNHSIGQIFDSNQNKDKFLRLKIGAGKVIKGWEEGMLGMKKAGRRLIVIPPALAYGSKGVPNRVPADSTLMFEVELRRVKFSIDSGCDQTSTSSKDSSAVSPTPSMENLVSESPLAAATSGPGRPGSELQPTSRSQPSTSLHFTGNSPDFEVFDFVFFKREPTLRPKSNSLSEQFANPDATKAKLISRMAKMGQPMLPFLTGAAGQPESSDSEFEDTSSNQRKDCPTVPSSVEISAPASHVATSALLPGITPVGSQSAPPGSNRIFQTLPVGQVYPAQAIPYMGSGDVTSFLMTEARQHNTEIRLAVGKVADKVEQLASKVDDLQRQGSRSMSVSTMTMETSMIVHNIQRIVQENECLKTEVFEKSSRIEEQNYKIGELINQNQRYMEQSHLLLEQRNDSIRSSSEQNQARLLQIEQDKQDPPLDLGSGQVHLTEELASSTARVSQLQLEASAWKQKAAELQSKLSSVLQENKSNGQCIATLETQLEELKETMERAQTQHRLEKQQRKQMELKAGALEEELQELKTDKQNLDRALSERKKRWQAERQQWDEEVEKLRRSSQLELDHLQSQLRKARTSNDNTASDQLSQLQVELEEHWRRKSEQMILTARETHNRELAEVTMSRDFLQDRFTELQEKYSALERHGAAEREKLEGQVAELQRKVEEPGNSEDTTSQVKHVMNGVFHTLRREFDLHESYSGRTVLEVIVTTIKNVTLQMLSGADPSSLRPATREEAEHENVKQTEGKSLHVNDEREMEEDKKNDKVQMIEEIKPETEPESESLIQTKDPEDLHPVSSPDLLPQKMAGVKSVVEQEQPSPPYTSSQEPDLMESMSPEGKAEDGSQLEDSQHKAATVICQVDVKNLEDAKNAGGEPAAPYNTFRPPVNPPPPPTALQTSSGKNMGPSGTAANENEEKLFFQTQALVEHPPAPSEEEEEDDLSMKGHPPPTPLFVDDEDDDLDWLT